MNILSHLPLFANLGTECSITTITPNLGDIMGLLESIIIVLLILWLGGFALHIAGGLIHLLLVVALVLIVMRLLRRRV